MFYRPVNRYCLLLILFFTLFLVNLVFAQQQEPLKRVYTISLPADSLKHTLQRLEARTGNSFAYDPDQLRLKYTGPLHFVQSPLSNILTRVLSGTNLRFSLVGNDIVITPDKANVHTIHGHIRDQATGEELIGATVQLPGLQAGVITNQYGFYSISVPDGYYQLLIAHPGYQSLEKNIHLDKDLQEEIELLLQPHILDEVVVKPSTVKPNPILINEQNFNIKQLNAASYYAGETDVMKRLQMQNGIKSITEGSSALFVRGGNSDQNLILLDEAIVYNPSHLYGLVSVFNSDVVNNLQVYRDYMPANFGGRLSSVVVNRMAEGNSKEYHINGGLNLMSARIAAEGPIVKEKGSFMVAYRRSLLDVFQNHFKLFNPNSVYYDINAKANYKLDSDNSIFYSIYVGKDNLLSENSYTNNWGNLTSTFRWNHLFNSKVFLNISAIYSNYSNLLDLNADTLSQKSQWKTGIKDLTLKADYTYYRSPANQIKFGVSGIYHQFRPGEMLDQTDVEFNIARNKSFESAVYYTQQIAMGRSWELNYGLRLGIFRNAEEQRNIFDTNGNLVVKNDIRTFINPEPRVNISFLPSVSQRIFLTYNLNFQYLQLVQNSTLAFSSLEPWVPASGKVRPQRSAHWALGYRYIPGSYAFSLGSYYKNLNNQLDLTGHAQIIRNPGVMDQLRAGGSDAYGAEMEVAKAEGRFTGTLAYTYSRVFRKIPDINFGNRFVANYDIPHELKVMAKFEMNNKLSFQSFFTYATGRPLTLPIGYYQHDGLNVPVYEGRNESRFPDFSRLDVSAQYRLKTRGFAKRDLSHVFSAGIYNLYNRKNPLYYHINSAMGSAEKNNIEYGFGLYPWLAYSFRL